MEQEVKSVKQPRNRCRNFGVCVRERGWGWKKKESQSQAVQQRRQEDCHRPRLNVMQPPRTRDAAAGCIFPAVFIGRINGTCCCRHPPPIVFLPYFLPNLLNLSTLCRSLSSPKASHALYGFQDFFFFLPFSLPPPSPYATFSEFLFHRTPLSVRHDHPLSSGRRTFG